MYIEYKGLINDDIEFVFMYSEQKSMQVTETTIINKD